MGVVTTKITRLQLELVHTGMEVNGFVHAVPLDPRAIHALQHSALAMDIYAWLAHRLCRIRKILGARLSK